LNFSAHDPTNWLAISTASGPAAAALYAADKPTWILLILVFVTIFCGLLGFVLPGTAIKPIIPASPEAENIPQTSQEIQMPDAPVKTTPALTQAAAASHAMATSGIYSCFASLLMGLFQHNQNPAFHADPAASASHQATVTQVLQGIQAVTAVAGSLAAAGAFGGAGATVAAVAGVGGDVANALAQAAEQQNDPVLASGGIGDVPASVPANG
jgi:hypothetical protein